MSNYTGTAAPVVADSWYTAEGNFVQKVKCVDTVHSDFKYYLNGRVVIGPDTALRIYYKCYPEKRNADGSFEEAYFIHNTTGERWDAERDIRLKRD